MKKISTLLAAIILMLTATSCGNDDDDVLPAKPSINASKA